MKIHPCKHRYGWARILEKLSSRRGSREALKTGCWGESALGANCDLDSGIGVAEGGVPVVPWHRLEGCGAAIRIARRFSLCFAYWLVAC